MIDDDNDGIQYRADDADSDMRQTLLEALSVDPLVADAVGALSQGGVDPADTVGLQRYVTEGEGEDPQTFEVSQDGASVTVTAGTIWADKANLPVGGGTLTLAGDTEWVYVWAARDLSAGGIDHMTETPTSSTDRIFLPLVKYTKVGTSWQQQGGLCHRGDFYFSQPVL
jgi:hypothetical protein